MCLTRIFQTLCIMTAVISLLTGTAFSQTATEAAPKVEVKPAPNMEQTPYGTFSFYAPLVSLFGTEPQVSVEVQAVPADTPAPAAPATVPSQTAAQQMALRYRILLLDRNNNVMEVTDRHKFHSGDRIRLIFESNIDGYLYIYQKGASGRGSCLFPDARINGGDNRVFKYRRIAVPPPVGASRGWWNFDRAAGKEEIFLFLSPAPIAELTSVVPAEGGYLDDAGWQVVTQYGGKCSAEVNAAVYYEGAGMDGWDYGDEPAQAYVVTQTPVLMHHLTLRHAK